MSETHSYTYRRLKCGSFHGSRWKVESWGLNDLLSPRGNLAVIPLASLQARVGLGQKAGQNSAHRMRESRTGPGTRFFRPKRLHGSWPSQAGALIERALSLHLLTNQDDHALQFTRDSLVPALGCYE